MPKAANHQLISSAVAQTGARLPAARTLPTKKEATKPRYAVAAASAAMPSHAATRGAFQSEPTAKPSAHKRKNCACQNPPTSEESASR